MIASRAMPTRFAIAAFALLVWASACLAAPDASRVAVFESACALYASGIEHRAAGKEAQALREFAGAAEAFATLVEQAPDNGELRRNLALALLQQHKLGAGIAELRRAQPLAATSPALRERLNADLELARSRVRTRFGGDPTPSLARTLQPVMRQSTLWLGLTLMAVGWALCAARVIAPARAPGLVLSACLIGLGALSAASVVVPLWMIERSASRAAVIVADDTVARTGPSSAGFPQAFDKPLSAGVELTITEWRGDWVAVTLPDTRTAWVPASSIEPVQPDRSRPAS
jgi:hypothetical protein